MCLSENQAMLCSEKQTETLTLTSYNSGSPYPQRNQLVDQIYQQLIRDSTQPPT